MPRPVKITPAQLEAMLGKQNVRTDVPISTMHTYIQDRQANPSEYEKDPPGFAAVHHLHDALSCRRCGCTVHLLVQAYGQGPCSIGEPVCLRCGDIEKATARKPKTRRKAGKKSTTRGTDLG